MRSPVRRVLVALLVAVSASGIGATPAAAHAVLLRSEPSPQSTVADAPSEVRLEFSEPVETAFGAVRVFDVDGARVDRGQVVRERGGELLRAPVRALEDGTYSVTWRVVSADGHRLSGGFVFYIGAPSAISPAAVAEEPGGSRVVGWGFGLVRFVWFAGLLCLVGFPLLRRIVWTPAVRAAGVADEVDVGFRARFRRGMWAAWLALVVAGLASIVLQAGTASGLPLGQAASARVLDEVLETTYGKAWLVQTSLALLLVVPVIALTARRRVLPGSPGLWLTAGAVLVTWLGVTTAVSGHARTDPNPVLAGTSVVVHLLAVACWAGGLAGLLVLARPAWRTAPDLRPEMVRRFGRLALIAVLGVAATGTLNSVTAMDGLADLWDTAYGRAVAAKVLLLLVALGLAARHQRRTGPRFTRTATVELVSLAGAVALAAALVALVPGRSLALAEEGPLSAERRAGSYTVQVFIDPTTLGANEVHVTFVDDAGVAAAEVTGVGARVTPPDGPAVPVGLRLLAPGHFAGDVEFTRRGRHRLTVGGPVSTTFTFTISRRA